MTNAEHKTNQDLDSTILDQDKLVDLAQLSTLEYDRRREQEAKELGVRVSTLDKLVRSKRRRTPAGDIQGGELKLAEPAPWPDPVDGVQLLDEIAAAVRNHVFMLDAAVHAVTLWVIHSYLVDCFTTSPRLAVHSPEKECGKTTLLDIIQKLSWRPLLTPSIQQAGVFRVIERWKPTLLIDEADTFLRDNDGLRGVLNSGHRKGEFVVRVEGDDREPRAFSVYGACAIALIGKLPDTLESRSISIELRRAKQGEVPRQFRYDRATDLDELAGKARRWADDNRDIVRQAEPSTNGLFNRVADNWRPLFAIAGAVGEPWAALARDAAKSARKGADDQSLRVLLLLDVRDVFWAKNTDRLRSAELAEALGEIEGRPWAEWKNGRAMTATALARQLAPFQIGPGTKRIGQITFKGYLLSDFDDAFERYLTDQSVTQSQLNNEAHFSRAQTVTARNHVTAPTAQKPNGGGHCDRVTVRREDIEDVSFHPDNEHLETPEVLRREPRQLAQADPRAPALGPPGDNLDDLR
jgi:putative DNA primase/helicase